mmetsp:Transcript_29172/g.86373  ORF Transcript_29172/g.86373 Transcript_29172/m.86373 type:complete len:89 (+) Transcript_29172:518-784(+)
MDGEGGDRDDGQDEELSEVGEDLGTDSAGDIHPDVEELDLDFLKPFLSSDVISAHGSSWSSLTSTGASLPKGATGDTSLDQSNTWKKS